MADQTQDDKIQQMVKNAMAVSFQPIANLLNAENIDLYEKKDVVNGMDMKTPSGTIRIYMDVVPGDYDLLDDLRRIGFDIQTMDDLDETFKKVIVDTITYLISATMLTWTDIRDKNQQIADLALEVTHNTTIRIFKDSQNHIGFRFKKLD